MQERVVDRTENTSSVAMVAPIGITPPRGLLPDTECPAERSHARRRTLARAPHARLYFIEDHQCAELSHSLRTAVR